MLTTIMDVWTPAQRAAVERCYETAADAETRTRCQVVLLAGEQGLRASQIAPVAQRDTATVRKMLRRFVREGSRGFRAAMRRGRKALARHGDALRLVYTPAYDPDSSLAPQGGRTAA